MIDIGGFVDNYCLNYPFITSCQGIYIIHLDTCTNIWLWFGEVVVVIVWYLDLPMPSVPITTNVVSSNPAQARCTWYNIMW